MAGAHARVVDDDDNDARHAEWQQTLIYNDIIPLGPVSHTHTHTQTAMRFDAPAKAHACFAKSRVSAA